MTSARSTKPCSPLTSGCQEHKKAIKAGNIFDTHGLLRPAVLEELQACDCILRGVNKAENLDMLRAIASLYGIRDNRDEERAEELHPHRNVPFCKSGRRLSAEMRPGARIGIPTGACRRLNEQAMEKKRAGADRGLLIAQIRNLVICGGTCSSAKRRIVRTGPMFGSPVQNRPGIWYNRKEKPIQAPGRRAKWQNEL